jgi:hypothetical protein
MGYHIKSEISVQTKNQIVAELFESRDFNDCLCKMEPSYLRDDLKAEVALILLETQDSKILELNRTNGLKFYTVRIILNLIQSNTSPFFKKFRGFTTDIIPEKPVEELNGRVQRELTEERAISIIPKLYWYDREIVELYLKLGNYRAIEVETGIPWESCYKTVQKAIKQIRSELESV